MSFVIIYLIQTLIHQKTAPAAPKTTSFSSDSVSHLHICPLTNLEANGHYIFLALKNCGHVFSKKALTECVHVSPPFSFKSPFTCTLPYPILSILWIYRYKYICLFNLCSFISYFSLILVLENAVFAFFLFYIKIYERNE